MRRLRTTTHIISEIITGRRLWDECSGDVDVCLCEGQVISNEIKITAANVFVISLCKYILLQKPPFEHSSRAS